MVHCLRKRTLREIRESPQRRLNANPNQRLRNRLLLKSQALAEMMRRSANGQIRTLLLFRACTRVTFDPSRGRASLLNSAVSAICKQRKSALQVSTTSLRDERRTVRSDAQAPDFSVA